MANAEPETCGNVLHRHADASNGTFFFTFNGTPITDKAGLWLQEKMKTQTLGQILEEAADASRREQEWEYYAAQLEELEEEAVDADAPEQRAHNRRLRLELEKYRAKTAELEQRLAELEARLVQIPAPAVEKEVVEKLFESEETYDDGGISELLKAAQTWEEVESAVGRDRDVLLCVTLSWSFDEKQLLVKLLSEYLVMETLPESNTDWIPRRLFDAAVACLL
jgi:hypothetical protein